MSVRKDAELRRQRKKRITLATVKAGPPSKPGASVRTRQRDEKRWRELRAEWAKLIEDCKPLYRDTYELYDIIVAQFTEAELEQSDNSTLGELWPKALKRLSAKVRELQKKDAAQKKQLTQAAADITSNAYKKRSR